MTSLLPILGLLGDTKDSQHILNGTFTPPPNLDIYTKKLLTAMRIPAHIKHLPPINISYSTEDYIQGWARMKEKTTSGKSNIHFGHHMACTKHYRNATFESQMSAIPYQTGYSPYPSL